MKNIIALALLITSLTTTYAQQEVGLTFLPSLVQARTQANPAHISDNKITLAFPGIYAGYQNSSFKIGDLFSETSTGRSFDLDPVLAKMPEQGNTIRQAVNFNSGAISFRLKNKFQVSLFHNQQMDMRINYPKALPELLWKGNSAFIGEEVNVGPKFDLLGYSEYGLGFAAKMNKKLTLGLNFKYLSGFMGVHTVKSDLSVYTNEEYYQLRLESDMIFQTAGLNDIFADNPDGALPREDLIYYLNSRNTGFAVDLGFTYQLNDLISIQGALQDLGNINWKQYVLEQKSQGVFEYDGQVVNPFDENSEFNFDEVSDSLGQLFEFTARKKAFVTNLPKRFFVGGMYQFRPDLQFGATLQGEHYLNATGVSFSFHAQKNLGRILSFGTLVGYHSRGGLMAGANTIVNLGPVQLFLISDNLIPLIDPYAGRNTNIRAGINLVFFKDKRAEQRVLPGTGGPVNENGSDL